MRYAGLKEVFLFCVCICFIQPFLCDAHAEFLSDDVLWNTPALSSGATDVHLSSKGSYIYAVWQGSSGSAQTLFFQVSGDNGETWLSQETEILNIPTEDALQQIDINADDGYVYVSWIRNDVSANVQKCGVAISGNQGQTWQVHDVATVSSSDFSGMDTAYDNGDVCVVWSAQEVYAQCSQDAGQTWSGPVVVNTTGFPISPGDVQREPAVAAGGSDVFYVVWTDNRGAPGGERYVYVTRSLDGGATWQTDQEVVDFSTNGPLCIEPDIVADKNGRVLVSWINKMWWGQGETYRYSISTAYSSNSGASWIGGATMDSYGISPELLVDETTGRFFIFWLNDNDHSYRKLQMKFSDNGGAEWSSTQVVGPHHDVQDTRYDADVSNNVVAAVWENLEPWPGIYANYSWDGGVSWLEQEQRIDHPSSDEIPILSPRMTVSQEGTIVAAWEDQRDGREDIYGNENSVSVNSLVRREADYIVSCQYVIQDNTYGAINNVQGDEPTWIVPRENAMAILGLLRASDFLEDSSYREAAQLAADYLIRVQLPDGAWANEYAYDAVTDQSESPTQTAEVMMALYHLGYQSDWYAAMKAGAQFLLSLQDVTNKGGLDDGLIAGGKDESGNFHTWRWASDNAYGYQALKAAYAWALIEEDDDFAQQCLNALERVIEGINTVLRDDPVWYTAVDEWGNPQGNPDLLEGYTSFPNWISYAPQMLDLPVTGVNDQGVGDWIASAFQQDDGSSIAYSWDENLKTRKYPGYSFQSALAWLDTGHDTYAQGALGWVLSSGLWDVTHGGWVDWVEVSPDAGQQAPQWQRFIDTSFYAIAALSGGYDFNSHHVLRLDVPQYFMDEQHYSGAAVAQMILSHMRKGVESEIDQPTIVTHVRGTPDIDSDFTADEMDQVLGVFDPYDALVSDGFDSYDDRPDGNPFQGYNFTVDAYDPLADDMAMERYMRDLAHWMSYAVTQRAWFLGPREMVENPHTPSAVPLFGSYEHWAVVRGLHATSDPAPDSQNPFQESSFMVYGFWMNDPAIDGIGSDTYKTADECEQNYFFPLTSNDDYNGMLVHVSEPPPQISHEEIRIARPQTRLQNLEMILDEDQEKAIQPAVQYTMALSADFITPDIPKSWRDLVDPVVMQEEQVVEAFDGKKQGEVLFVHRLDDATLNYYLVPYGEWKNKTFFANGVILLDADEGYFKEMSWQKKATTMLALSSGKARRIAMLSVIQEYCNVVKQLRRYSWFRKRWAYYYRFIIRHYQQKLVKVMRSKPDLVWSPSSETPNPYQPIWRISMPYNQDIYVTQEGRMVKFEKSE